MAGNRHNIQQCQHGNPSTEPEVVSQVLTTEKPRSIVGPAAQLCMAMHTLRFLMLLGLSFWSSFKEGGEASGRQRARALHSHQVPAGGPPHQPPASGDRLRELQPNTLQPAERVGSLWVGGRCGACVLRKSVIFVHHLACGTYGINVSKAPALRTSFGYQRLCFFVCVGFRSTLVSRPPSSWIQRTQSCPSNPQHGSGNPAI